MKTYQIGNKVTCVVRTYCPSKIGEVQTQYNNEPYTILKDVAVSISFTEKEKNAKDGDKFRQLYFNNGCINQVTLTDVNLTNKVLNMLFTKYDTGLKTHSESVDSDENGHIFLTTTEEKIYQVFIYDTTEQMIQAYGEINPLDIELTPNSSYLIVYQTLGTISLGLNNPNNQYYTLDLICEGNTNEETAPTYIHIQKTGLKSNKSLYFNARSNAVDLVFNVIATEDDYIVLE